MNINNVPVGCHICGGMAHGKENISKTARGVLHECVWICSKCGGVAKRHSEEIVEHNEQRSQNR